MAIQEASGFCKHCDRQVLVRRKGTNHLLHLFLSLATFGTWAFIWFLSSIKIGGWRCSNCGLKSKRKLFA
jgi:hypothetical protein